jgi:hypothetical protein
MNNKHRAEKLFWSIALPGFGQLLNGKYVKGLVLIALEIIINTRSNLNEVIIFSFHGQIQEAIGQTNYHWLMFYPCIYMFGIWDAYRDAGNENNAYSFLPFVFAAYIGTIGVIYSPTLSIYGVKFGPVWLPILFLFLGGGIGYLLKRMCMRAPWNKKIP